MTVRFELFTVFVIDPAEGVYLRNIRFFTYLAPFEPAGHRRLYLACTLIVGSAKVVLAVINENTTSVCICVGNLIHLVDAALIGYARDTHHARLHTRQSPTAPIVVVEQTNADATSVAGLLASKVAFAGSHCMVPKAGDRARAKSGSSRVQSPRTIVRIVAYPRMEVFVRRNVILVPRPPKRRLPAYPSGFKRFQSVGTEQCCQAPMGRSGHSPVSQIGSGDDPEPDPRPEPCSDEPEPEPGYVEGRMANVQLASKTPS